MTGWESIPHTRGDEPFFALTIHARQLYSPHAWG